MLLHVLFIKEKEGTLQTGYMRSYLKLKPSKSLKEKENYIDQYSHTLDKKSQ